MNWINDHKKIIRFIICMAVVFYFLLVNAKVTLVVRSNSSQEENGNLIVYYQKSNVYGFNEDTLNVQGVSLSSDSIDVRFSLDTMKLRDIRLDFDGIDEFGIKDITVYIGKIKMLTYDAETLSKVIVAVNDAETDYIDNELHLQSTGGDSYSVFGIANSRITVKFVIIMILFGVAASVALFVLVEKLMLFYDKDKEKSRKILKVAFLLLLAGIVFYSDFQLAEWIGTKTTDEYMIQTSQKGTISLQNDNIDISFTSHGKKLKEIKIQAAESNQYKGMVTYKITEDDNVIGGDSLSIDDVASGTELVFDVSSLNLNRGADYALSISFDLQNEIQLVTNSDGTICYKQIFDFVYAPLIVGIVVAINIIIFLFGYLVWKKAFEDYLLAIFSIVIGIFIALIITPCSMDDEYRHFLRAYEMSNGNIIEQSVESLPDNVTGVPPILANGRFVYAAVPDGIDRIKYLDQEANYPEQTYYAEVSSRLSLDELFYQLTMPENAGTENVSMASTTGLSPLSYLPQIVMLLIGKIFGVKSIVLFYLARIGNVIGCTFIILLAAKLLPQYRSLIWTVFFIPRITILRSSCSTDALLYGLVVLLIAYILHLKMNQLAWTSPKRILIVFLLTAYIAVMKLPYILTAGLVLILGPENYKHISKKWQAILCNLLIVGVIGIASLMAYENVTRLMCARLEAPETVVEAEELTSEETTGDSGSTIMQDEHIQYFIQNTGAWFGMILREYAGVYQRAKTSINGYFCLGNIYLLMLLLLLLGKKNGKYIERIYMLLIAAGIWFGILMVFYRMADPAVQSIPWIGDRYILPVIPLVAFALPQGNETTEKILNTYMPYALIAVTGANAVSIISLFG